MLTLVTLAWISPQSLTGQSSNPTMSVSLLHNRDDDAEDDDDDDDDDDDEGGRAVRCIFHTARVH